MPKPYTRDKIHHTNRVSEDFLANSDKLLGNDMKICVGLLEVTLADWAIDKEFGIDVSTQLI